MKDAKGHGSEAHMTGVNQVGQPKLNSYGLPHVGSHGEPLPDTAPHSVYVGQRDVVMSETAAPDFFKGKYLIHPVADNGDLDSEGYDSKKAIESRVREYKQFYPNIRVVRL